MKTYKQKDIDDRFNTSAVKPVVELFEGKKIGIKNYNKQLKIIIPGVPIADSRPRFAVQGDSVHAYNVHKANLVKVFKRIYDNSILEKVCILSPLFIDMIFYVPVPKKHKKNFNKSQTKSLMNESYPATSRPDNDNYEKVHYDLLQDAAYQIILRDECITENRTRKFFVSDKKYARAEINIYYTDQLDSWYKDALYDSRDYLKYQLSPKYFKINNIPREQWKLSFFKTIMTYKRKTTNIKDLEKTVRKVLTIYKTDEIYLLAKANNRDQAIQTILEVTERIQ